LPRRAPSHVDRKGRPAGAVVGGRGREGDHVRSRARRWLQQTLDAAEKRRDNALTVRAGDPLAARFASFGRGSHIAFPRLLLSNPGAVAIGENVEIRSYLCIEAYGAPGTVLIEIGSGSIIGHFARFVAVNGIYLAER